MGETRLSAKLLVSRKFASANFDHRALPISMLVLHYTGMQNAQMAIDRLCDSTTKVSAHYLLDEQGQVFELVTESQRAWHAGVSSWRSISDINSASIGIEVVNGGHDFDLPKFPEAQISALIELCQDILQRHKIPPCNIVGHNEIAPMRKLDPGEKFPWQQLAKAGIGLWPNAIARKPIANMPSQAEVKKLLSAIGYNVTKAKISGSKRHCLISEFQRRYRPQQIDGLLDGETSLLLRQIADLTNRHKTD